MLIDFTKMHGLGNDFMVVDNLAGDITFNAEQISNLANRHFGIGFDQLLVVETSNTKDIDFRYVIYNADGLEVEQCGNGARCFARFVSEKGLSNNNPIVVETRSGIISLHLNDNDNTVRVDMGVPIWKPSEIPFTQMVNEKATYNIEGFEVGVVSMGNPHAVLVVKDINKEIKKTAKEIQGSDYFKKGVNVNFVEISSNNKEITLRTYERGVGETLACGSGACATVAYLHKLGKVKLEKNKGVQVNFSKGFLYVDIKDKIVSMIGSAESVFEGRVEI